VGGWNSLFAANTKAPTWPSRVGERITIDRYNMNDDGDLVGLIVVVIDVGYGIWSNNNYTHFLGFPSRTPIPHRSKLYSTSRKVERKRYNRYTWQHTWQLTTGHWTVSSKRSIDSIVILALFLQGQIS
jgi:hypothetical protein